MPVTIRADGLLNELERRAVDMAVDLGDALVEEIQGNASRRTGAMAESTKRTEPVIQGSRITLHVRVEAEHGIYQDQGTGIFGPEGRPIVPKRRGGVLVFDWPAAGGLVFARSVRGSEPTRFFTKAIQAWPQIVRRQSRGG